MTDVYPKVSILKPICNIDDGLEGNLSSFFKLDYPNYEIIFGIDTLDQRCLELVEKVKTRYFNISSKIISTFSEKILNPKITTLVNMEKSCEGDLYWLTDSNIRVEPHTLKNLVHEYLFNNSKIVFSPIRGTGSRSFGSIMENAYLNLFVSGNIIGAWKYFKKQITVGKSMLIHRSALERYGGFGYFKEYLAEDYIISDTFERDKLKVSTNFTWVTNFISSATIIKFWHRVDRWAKIRFFVRTGFYIPEIILNPIVLSAFSIIFLGNTGVKLLCYSILFKVIIEYINFFFINIEDRKKIGVILIYPFCMIIKDIILFLIYLISFVNRTVVWRGRKIKIKKGSKIIKITA